MKITPWRPTFLLILLSFTAKIVADETTVWVTATIAPGVVVTTKSFYTQTFSTFDGVMKSVKSGSIGLGTITGETGVTKTIT